MTIGLIGKKQGMTRVFTPEGDAISVTVVSIEPNTITQIKSEETDGYSSVQVTTGSKKEKHLTKPQLGHFTKNSIKPGEGLWEFRVTSDEITELEVGSNLFLEQFEEGQLVDVSGTSKGKGFQGVVKRHGFAGVGQATHGQHNRLRAPGSIGAASYPARVFKGMKMAGRMGNDKITIQNLRVLKVVADKNLLVLKGCVPGHKNSFVIIRK